MALLSIPTSADISIEVNGQKVAAAQSYRVQSARESRYIEAFGSREPVGTVGGRVQHNRADARLPVPDRRDRFLQSEWV